MKDNLYFDYASATPLRSEVLEAMRPYFSDFYGNPSSIHSKGKEAKEAIEKSRKTIAQILNCKTEEIIFTAGGTESDNMALLGVMRHVKNGGLLSVPHMVCSAIEHEAVLRPAQYLEQKEGCRVSYIKVNNEGIVDVQHLVSCIRDETVLVSIMYANNEIGTIQPIAEIAEIIRDIRKERKKQNINVPLWFHTDACQAALFLDMDVERLGVDLLTMNASKIYGPKQIGALYVRSEVSLEPMMFGGGQEKGMRPGTENVPAIVGFSKAFEIAYSEKEKEGARLMDLRNLFIKELKELVPEAVLNGNKNDRLANNINVSIIGYDSEVLLAYLNEANIFASSGSACTSERKGHHHVLVAMGYDEKRIKGALRFTIGKETSKNDCLRAVNALADSIKRMKLFPK